MDIEEKLTYPDWPAWRSRVKGACLEYSMVVMLENPDTLIPMDAVSSRAYHNARAIVARQCQDSPEGFAVAHSPQVAVTLTDPGLATDDEIKTTVTALWESWSGGKPVPPL